MSLTPSPMLHHRPWRFTSLLWVFLLLGFSMGARTAHAATYYLTNLAGHPASCNPNPGDVYDWFDARNWSTTPNPNPDACPSAGPPGAGDTSVIDSNRTVNIVGAVTVANLQISKGAINYGSTVNLPGSSSSTGSLTVTGSLDFAGNDIEALTLTVPTGATFNYHGGGFNNVIVNNFGTTNFDSPNLNNDWLGSGAFNNKPGALFNDSATVDTRLGGGFPFNNEGTFRKTSTGTLIWQAVFNNNSMVDVQGGALELDNGGTHSGTENIAAGASLVLHNADAPYNFTPTSVITGAGQVYPSISNPNSPYAVRL